MHRYLPCLWLLATACPQDLSSANIVPGDGGVWVPNNDGGVTFIDPGDSPLDTEVLPDLPPMEVLCTLFAGDYHEKNDYGRENGTWIGDIQDERFLGKPAANAKYIGRDTANLRYTYRKPGTADERVSVSMGFEQILTVEKEGAEVYAGNSALKGHPYPEPWFLNRIEAQGLEEQPLCWDPFLRHSTEYHWLPCDWCAKVGREFLICVNEDAVECFY